MMAAASVKNHPNFAVICSFLHRYGEHLRLPDLTIPELEQVLEETDSIGHGLKELLIALMRRVVNSFMVNRWERHLIRLIDNYHSHIEAWELESYGFSLCKLDTKLSILKYLCETQFDDNPKFKNIVNKEDPQYQRLKPLGRDKLGLVYWYQKDHDSNIRVYREEQDDIEETSWQSIVRGREDLALLITELRLTHDLKPLDSLESSRSATPTLTNGETKPPVKSEQPPKQETAIVNGIGDDVVKTEPKEPAETTGIETGERDHTTVSQESRGGKNGEEQMEEGCRTHSTHPAETTKSDSVSTLATQEVVPTNGTETDRKSSGGDEGVVGQKDDGKGERTKEHPAAGSKGVGDELKDATESKNDATGEKGLQEELGVNSRSHGAGSKDQTDSPEANESCIKLGTGDLSPNRKLVEEDGRKELEASGSQNSEEREAKEPEECKEAANIEGNPGSATKVGSESISEMDSTDGDKTVERLESSNRADEKILEDEKGGSPEEGKGLSGGLKGDSKEVQEGKPESGRSAGDASPSAEETEGGATDSKVVNDSKREEENKVDSHGERETEKDSGKVAVENKAPEVKGNSRTRRTKAQQKDDNSAPRPTSTRRLRERKPPPKKEVVVEEPPPKPQRQPTASKKAAKGALKRPRGRAKSSSSESESSSDDELLSLAHIKNKMEKGDEEEDEESEEEKANSTDQDHSSVEPVKKARTAKSKKSAATVEKEAEPVEIGGDPCIKCGNYEHPEQILLCDTCDAGYHTACLRPPLMYVPDGEWFCPKCEHATLLENLETVLLVLDSELKVIEQKRKKKQSQFQYLLTEVCPANILPDGSSVLITKRVEKVEKPERPRPERTRPRPKKVFVEEPEEIEYIQRKSGRNRKKISYKFEEFDSAINTAIHDEVEKKREAKASGEHIVYGQSRGKDISTIEAAEWEEEEMAKRAARKKRKSLTDLEASTEEEKEEDDSDDEFKIKSNDDRSDEDFLADDNEVSDEIVSEVSEELELDQSFSGSSSSGSEYGRQPRRGANRGRRKKRVKVRSRRNKEPVRRSVRNVGRETAVYDDSSSSEAEDNDRPRDAWRRNPIITARRQRPMSEDSPVSENEWDGGGKGRRKRDFSSGEVNSDEEERSPKKKKRRDSGGRERRQKKRKQRKKESSSSEHNDGEEDDDDEGYVQPKRKFRINSEDSADDKNDKKGSENEEDEKDIGRNKKRDFGRSFRGKQKNRVDYRKMAEGSSSPDEDGSDKGEDSAPPRGQKGARSKVKNCSADSGAEVVDSREKGEEDGGGPKTMKGGEPTGRSKSEKSSNSGESEVSTKGGTGSLKEEEDASLSPMSDEETVKDIGVPSRTEVKETSSVGKKTSSEEDDLEGVTDIFDYLTKE